MEKSAKWLDNHLDQAMATTLCQPPCALVIKFLLKIICANHADLANNHLVMEKSANKLDNHLDQAMAPTVTHVTSHHHTLLTSSTDAVESQMIETTLEKDPEMSALEESSVTTGNRKKETPKMQLTVKTTKVVQECTVVHLIMVAQEWEAHTAQEWEVQMVSSTR
jgi:hypothetical protein